MMLYPTSDAWRGAERKRVLVYGMSGLGKTHLSTLLRASGDWFHYSVDYRIGTRYMGEHIADNFKREAMKVPLLRELLLSDSVYITSNITFENLSPLSTYLGKPGDPARGGLPFEDYMRRQEQHRIAEISAMLDSRPFADRAVDLYGYDNFICDTSGSICEVLNLAEDPEPLLEALASNHLMIWLKGSDAHTAELVKRFDRDPKPMYYQAEFLRAAWADYRTETGLAEDAVDPDAFVRWTYARALAHRQPRYAEMARRHGLTMTPEDFSDVRTAQDFVERVALAIDAQQPA